MMVNIALELLASCAGCEVSILDLHEESIRCTRKGESCLRTNSNGCKGNTR